MTPADYRRAVRAVVASIPSGRVMSYGAIAAYLAELSGRASPRLVGHVMAIDGDGVPWHRVVRENGHPVRGLEARALRRLRDEGAPMRGRLGLRVDMTAAAWAPDEPPEVMLDGVLLDDVLRATGGSTASGSRASGSTASSGPCRRLARP